MITQKFTHVSEAIAKLIQQFKGKVNTEAFISIVAGQIQELENAFFEVLDETDIEVSVGEQLDGFGRFINLPRNGMSDTVYRAFLKAKRLVVRSTTTIEEIIAILDVLTGSDKTLELTETPDTDKAYFHIQIVEEILDADPLVDFLIVAAMFALTAKAAGVNGVVSIRREGRFRFDTTGYGFDQGARFSTTVGDS